MRQSGAFLPIWSLTRESYKTSAWSPLLSPGRRWKECSAYRLARTSATAKQHHWPRCLHRDAVPCPHIAGLASSKPLGPVIMAQALIPSSPGPVFPAGVFFHGWILRLWVSTRTLIHKPLTSFSARKTFPSAVPHWLADSCGLCQSKEPGYQDLCPYLCPGRLSLCQV